MAAMSSEDFVALMVEGALEDGGPIARPERSRVCAAAAAQPVLHTRRRIVIGEHSIIGSMRHGVRWTEELLVKALFATTPSSKRRHSLRRLGREAHQLHPRGRDVHPSAPICCAWLQRALQSAALDLLCDWCSRIAASPTWSSS